MLSSIPIFLWWQSKNFFMPVEVVFVKKAFFLFIKVLVCRKIDKKWMKAFDENFECSCATFRCKKFLICRCVFSPLVSLD